MAVKTLSSRLSKRVVLQQEVETPDGAGGYSLAWQNVANVWAEIIPLRASRSNEPLVAGQIENRSFFRITIRYVEGAVPKMRLTFGLREFNIIGVINPDESNELLEIYAIEGGAL